MTSSRKLSEILHDAASKETFEEDPAIAKNFKTLEKELKDHIKNNLKAGSPKAAKFYNNLIDKYTKMHDERKGIKSFSYTGSLPRSLDVETIRLWVSAGAIAMIMGLTGYLVYLSTEYINTLDIHTKEIEKAIEINYKK